MPDDKKPGDTKKKMSAVAAIVNPITEANTDKNARRVLLHYADTSNQTLTLEQRILSSNAAGTVRSWAAGSDATALKPPSLANPSTLVALNVDDYVHVYGVLDDGNNTISLVSPVFQSLQTRATTGIIAGSTDKKANNAWIYYESSNNNAPYIAMKEVSGTAEGDPDSGCQDVNPGTWIDAVNDTGRINWIAYQKKSGIIAVLNQNKRKPTEVNSNKSHFRPNTPIAMTFVSKALFPEGHFSSSPNARGKLYVYWLNDEKILQRAVAVISTNSDFPNFGEPERVGIRNEVVAEYSQMSVVVNKAENKNVIYAIKDTNSSEVKLSVIDDLWFTPKEDEE